MQSRTGPIGNWLQLVTTNHATTCNRLCAVAVVVAGLWLWGCGCGVVVAGLRLQGCGCGCGCIDVQKYLDWSRSGCAQKGKKKQTGLDLKTLSTGGSGAVVKPDVVTREWSTAIVVSSSVSVVMEVLSEAGVMSVRGETQTKSKEKKIPQHFIGLHSENQTNFFPSDGFMQGDGRNASGC